MKELKEMTSEELDKALNRAVELAFLLDEKWEAASADTKLKNLERYELFQRANRERLHAVDAEIRRRQEKAKS